MSNTDDGNSKISLTFDDIITTLSSNESFDTNKIEQQFLRLLGGIADLEETNKPLFYHYRHRYHTLRVSYFRRINSDDKVIKEEQLLSKYATLREHFPISEVTIVPDTLQQASNDIDENNDYIVFASWSDIHTQIGSLNDLADVDQIIEAFGRIRKSLEPLFQCEIRTLDEFRTLQQNCTSILRAFDTLKIGELHEAIDDEKSNSNYLNSIMESIDFVTNKLENRQTFFANDLLSDIFQLEKLLFHDVPQTKQCITRRYYEWARIFHSDKHHCNPVFDDLMKNINTIRDRYLSKINIDLASVERVQYELDKGHRHYQLSCEYKKRSACASDPDYSPPHLQRLASTEALWAFEHYRAALKSLGKMKKQNSEADILQRVEILTFMALMMYQAGTYEIEAQIYIVAGIYIITLPTMTPQLQQKLRQLQDDLKRYQQTPKSPTVIPKGPLLTNGTGLEVILCTNKAATPQQIHDEAQLFLRETILRQCVLRSGQPADLAIDISQLTLEEETFTTLNSRSRMIKPILSGTIVTVSGSLIIYGVNNLLNKITLVKRTEKPSLKDLTPEYGIRQSLNEMMRKAVEHYNNGRYAQFIDCLAEPYYHSRCLMAVKRGSETISIEIRVDQFIMPLLKHGFRADKIAHLLVLIGEVFLRGVDFADSTLKNPEYTALLEQSKILFQGVYDTVALRDAARDLDKRVERYHHAIITKCAPNLLHEVSAKDITDAQKSPFISRLDRYCQLARLNYAIACLLAGGQENLERCKQALTNLKQMANKTHDKFFVIPEERIHALEDLLSALGMDDDTNENENNSMHFLSPNMNLKLDQIEWMKTGYNSYHLCKLVLPVMDEDDQLTLLDCLLLSKHHFEYEQFIQFVLTKNPMNDERINALLRKEHVSTLSEWADNFRMNKKIFKHCAYLPLLSEFGNMHIQPCDVDADERYGSVFVAIPSQTALDYTQGKEDPRYLYVVVRSGEDRISAVFTIVSDGINQLHSKLKCLTPEDPRRVELLLSIATHYRNEAQRLDKRNHLAALSDWQQACNYYKQVVEMYRLGTITTRRHQMALLSYCKCLIKLHRYSCLSKHLNNAYDDRKDTLNSADIWLVYAQARRKAGDYDSAKLWIKKAIDLEPLNVDVQRERKTINLRDERHLVNKPTVFNTRIANLDDKLPWCNILSIDGGGIRGIIPAVWLMEIERKLQQPISSVFHVIAGTSTGAIIAAGLSAPSDTQRDRPRHQAYDLVQLYKTKADKVFTKSSTIWGNIRARYLQAPQYLDDGRQTVFEEYFNTLKLSDSLTELVVPSVRAESNITDIFTRQSAVNDLSKNFFLKDVLMCTTAAPTYFPAYSFNNTVYVDGGVQANNPAMIAYSHALGVNRNSSAESRILLLSLGTGDYVPDPLHPTASRDILFWQRNHQTVLKTVMDGPQNNIDMQLGNIIGDNYYRWQVWLENPIKLDDIQSNTIDRLVDIAHEQLEEMEGYDNSQRLGCLIEKLRLPNEP